MITPRWDLKFRIHTNTSNLAIDVMLAKNPIGKCDQPIVYMFWLLNNVEKNYTTKREVMAMV